MKAFATGQSERWNVIELTRPQIEYLSSQLLGRVATTGADGKPHVVPTSFRHNAELGTIDIGGHHVATTKKYRDVQANPWAAIVVDDLVSTDPWTPRMIVFAVASSVPVADEVSVAFTKILRPSRP